MVNTCSDCWGSMAPGPEVVSDGLFKEIERQFDAQWYLETYPDIERAGVDPAWHYFNFGMWEGRQPCRLDAWEWDEALWFQESPADECLQALHPLTAHDNPLEVSFAGFALGRWYAWKQQWAVAADALAHRGRVADRVPAFYPAELLEADALARCGRLSPAWRKAASLFDLAPGRSENWLVVANLLASVQQSVPPGAAEHSHSLDDQRLRWINQVWQRHGLHPVRRKDPGQPLTIDNLMATDNASSGGVATTADRPLVSVIIPAFNAGEGLLTALRGLADQTLRRSNPHAIEVLVVDDASTDNTAALAEAFAKANPGFRVLRQAHNQGAYSARNRGLSEARGDLLTVHDSDDWSHPQKLEIQCRGMQDNPGWMACNSHWVRCTPELRFGIWRMADGWVFRNTSSLMFRREVFGALGYWDLVRVEADTEYYLRIKAAFGESTTGEVAVGVPLSFGRTLPTSLTMTSDTHLVTQFGGLRADYRKAVLRWHAQAQGPESLYVEQQPQTRPFPAPQDILP
ncbi:glycosyltransferase [Marinobacter bryozoorum]|uniref:glycosyltransferase family 2 protein n=1 Tax=Marinobacter bryozoorum TaxID=256324 RepID=UPI002003896D|nr:glycosyltransferase family 2 protein [Marinobacter bryozoorum]MCK7544810.1 glycosyltransferase [Marinobacter bryozoorum]